MNDWSKLFSHSNFFSLNKEKEKSIYLELYQDRIEIPLEVLNFHPQKKEEFILGRACASEAYKLTTGHELLSLPRGSNRAPQWPTNIVGSISHNQYWVGATVAKNETLLGVGIDFEVMGRTKLELSKIIRNSGDLVNHVDLSEAELLTVIFSTKESLFKALNPIVNVFFGFDSAALKEINFSDNSFLIELTSDLSPFFGPSSRKSFSGKFSFDQYSCLTVIEVTR